MSLTNTATQLESKRARLQLYLDHEAKILTGGVQAYGYGPRSVTKYNTELGTVRKAIKELEAEILDLERKLDNKKPRKAVGIVPRDV